MTMNTYVVWCERTGGVFASATALLKVNGDVQYFRTKEEAEAACPKNSTLNTGARLSYWVERYTREDVR